MTGKHYMKPPRTLNSSPWLTVNGLVINVSHVVVKVLWDVCAWRQPLFVRPLRSPFQEPFTAGMRLEGRQPVHHLGSDWNISATLGWIDIKLCFTQSEFPTKTTNRSKFSQSPAQMLTCSKFSVRQPHEIRPSLELKFSLKSDVFKSNLRRTWPVVLFLMVRIRLNTHTRVIIV